MRRHRNLKELSSFLESAVQESDVMRHFVPPPTSKEAMQDYLRTCNDWGSDVYVDNLERFDLSGDVRENLVKALDSCYRIHGRAKVTSMQAASMLLSSPCGDGSKTLLTSEPTELELSDVVCAARLVYGDQNFRFQASASRRAMIVLLNDKTRIELKKKSVRLCKNDSASVKMAATVKHVQQKPINGKRHYIAEGNARFIEWLEANEELKFHVDGRWESLEVGTVVPRVAPTKSESKKLLDDQRSAVDQRYPWVIIEWKGDRRRVCRGAFRKA